MAEPNNITIDGTEYNVDNLSNEAKGLINQIRMIDAEIQNIDMKKAIYQTARNTYASHLKQHLPTPNNVQ